MANDFSFLSLLFLEKEAKNIRCAKIPKNCTSKAKSFKLLLLASEARRRNFIVLVIKHSKVVVLY